MDPFAALESVATAPVLLVASDYDGTLAPIVSDPTRAFPHRETLVALKALAGLPQTSVALISGRALRDLAMLTGSPSSVHLVGSHGSEFDPGFAETLSPETTERLAFLVEALREIGEGIEGVIIEEKPASVAFHYRNVAAERQEELAKAVLDGPARRDGVFVRPGKKVVELSVVATHKGAALEAIRGRLGGAVTLYLGDDVTDEDAFATLRGPDIGVKIGEGKTRARYRLRDTHEAARFLAALSERRTAWLTGSGSHPIERHSLLSDARTAALVTDDGRVTWLCVPRIDSPAIFAELLGGPASGFFAVRSEDGVPPREQQYEKDSLVLRTTWPTFECLDYLDASAGRPRQRSGRTDLVRVLRGAGRVCVEFAPRLDFGRELTRLLPRDGGLEVDSPEPMVLRSAGIQWEIVQEGGHDTARATVELGKDPVVLELRVGTRSLAPLSVKEGKRRRRTRDHWQEWAAHLELPSLQPELVRRSALTIKALCYGPTGAVAAAATTSLPESMGGVRNWDYRYSWIRDGALAVQALARLGSLTEGMHFLDWLLGAVDGSRSAEWLRPVYTVAGEELGIEADITELAGYAGSRPVRIGNAAARQLQLDVLGPVIDLMLTLHDGGAPITTEHWRMAESMVSAVARRWREADHGIWEVRGPRRHFVHSKVMCWQAVDRAMLLGEHLMGVDRDDWRRLRDEIRDDVLERGWKEAVHSFAAAYDGTDLDAATLQVGLTGLLPPDDRRFQQTVAAVEKFLRDGPTVHRYRYDDGLPGSEGGFHLCTAWLVESLALLDRREEAESLFRSLCALAGPTGLLSEEYDPQQKLALGNHPQVYSHLGLIQAALSLSR